MAFHLSAIARVKSMFLKSILGVYIIAFASLFLQTRSIFGDNGVVPLRDFMAKPEGTMKAAALHSLITFAPKLGLTYVEFVEFISIVCILLALCAMVSRNFANSLTFGFLWYSYYSICLVGQGFMSFHSDLLLLEVGFITILVAPLLPTYRMSQSDHDHLTFYLLKWVTFRYFVSNVLNVYLDGDDAWYKMTAIRMVAQSTPFPSLFSWRSFSLPDGVLQMYQAYEHSVKLCAPFLMFLDLKYSRFMAFYSLFFVCIPSALLFNFGWTDLVISICLLTYLKDAYFYTDKRAKQSGVRSFIDILCVLTYIAGVVAIMVRFYGLRYEKNVFKADVMFTVAQFKLFADHFVPISLVIGTLGLLSSAYTTYFSGTKKTSIIKNLFYTVIVVVLFFSTFPTLMRFAPNLEEKAPAFAYTKELSRNVAPFHLSNNYILLSKVSQFYADGRPELQVQVRTSNDQDWQQLDLRYKPGSPSRDLSRVVPHLPRIDLKMWYAARSSLQNNQWLQTYTYRLATKEKEVLVSLAKDVIVPTANQVRVALFTYRHAYSNEKAFSTHWSLAKFKSEYLPTTTLENLKFNVKSNGVSLAKSITIFSGKPFEKLIRASLEFANEHLRYIENTIVVWTLGAVAAFSTLKTY